MIHVLLAAWLWLNNLFSPGQVSKNNQIRQAAQAAYASGQYGRALSLYTYLNRHTTTTDPAVLLNIGHSLFQLKQYQQARNQYERLLQTGNPAIRTSAATQLGVLTCLAGDSARALNLFQEALLENADNQAARYNFEVVKTFYSGKLPNKKKQTNRQREQIEKPKPAGVQVERSDRQDELLRRFRRLNMSEAQAMQVLDAMQEDDLPYALTRSARRSSPKADTGGNRW